MWFIDNIVTYCNNISSFFYSIYLEVNSWVYPFWLAATLFYSLSTAFNSLAWQFYYFGQWVDTTASKLLEILSWSTIQSYITNWLYYLHDLGAIFYYFWTNVTNVISNWWASTQYTVQGWIDVAKQELLSFVNTLNTWLANLQAAWDSFKDKIPTLDEVISWWGNWAGNVLSTVNTWWSGAITEVQGLIDSAFTAYEPFWAGWQDWRDSVIEFIQDPWQWLYDRAEDLFDRFW